MRNPEKAKLLQQFGVQAIVGSNSDIDKLEALAAEADCVITTVRTRENFITIKLIQTDFERPMWTILLPLKRLLGATKSIRKKRVGYPCSFIPYATFWVPILQIIFSYHDQSGTGVLADKAGGQYAYQRIYDDMSVADIESLDPKTQIHRDVDITVTEGDKEGESKLIGIHRMCYLSETPNFFYFF